MAKRLKTQDVLRMLEDSGSVSDTGSDASDDSEIVDEDVEFSDVESDATDISDVESESDHFWTTKVGNIMSSSNANAGFQLSGTDIPADELEFFQLFFYWCFTSRYGVPDKCLRPD